MMNSFRSDDEHSHIVPEGEETVEETDEETDEESLYLNTDTHSSLQEPNNNQSACTQHGGTCDCAPGFSTAAFRARSKGTNETDCILLDAIEQYDPLSKSRKEIARTWEDVAKSCRERGLILLANTDKATHFQETTGKWCTQRWLQLKKEYEKYRGVMSGVRSTGTTQTALTLKLQRVETLVAKEEGFKTRAKKRRREEEEKRRRNYVYGKMISRLAVRDDGGQSDSSDSTDSDSTQDDPLMRAGPPASAANLSSTSDLTQTIAERMVEFENSIAEMRQIERARHEASQSELRHINSIIAQSLESAKEDRQKLNRALEQVMNTQRIIVQVLSKLADK
ncbi:hypothetical protein DFQ27_006205 [Actinomortierella ambigua]|uniref:Uncharacterized protein n=1 Tax=Actinomortierella ambigua TaxID=1343610 RepID=A0A9P6PX14_9FUNG|nr:hypothetical protein DFQ27_006205 [Actinomortierella ambigua]